jgi:hypothetical protein
VNAVVLDHVTKRFANFAAVDDVAAPRGLLDWAGSRHLDLAGLDRAEIRLPGQDADRSGPEDLSASEVS